jgi:hypothetical protein
LSPGEQVDAGQGEFQPGGVDGEWAGGEAPEVAVFAAADAVLRAGVSAVVVGLPDPALRYRIGTSTAHG